MPTSVDEIRASHVLEHFPNGQIEAVIADWVRCLKKGGKLKIAVPDFEKIAKAISPTTARRTRATLFGGQTDANDFHTRCSIATSCASCSRAPAWC
jgi:predicted SAM-dependent methyltransferase